MDATADSCRVLNTVLPRLGEFLYQAAETLSWRVRSATFIHRQIVVCQHRLASIHFINKLTT